MVKDYIFSLLFFFSANCPDFFVFLPSPFRPCAPEHVTKQTVKDRTLILRNWITNLHRFLFFFIQKYIFQPRETKEKIILKT